MWCWGGLGLYMAFAASPTQVMNLHDVIQIGGGGRAVCALSSDSTIWCWTAEGVVAPARSDGSGSAAPAGERRGVFPWDRSKIRSSSG